MEIHECPYCGSDDVAAEWDGVCWYVQCGNCSATGEMAYSADEAVISWNERAKARWQELAASREMMAG